MKIIDVIEKIKQCHVPIDEAHTCDTVKFGDTEQECTGIVTTVCATVQVIRQAAAVGANLIICHEPLFYSNEDSQEWLTGNSVYEQKVKLLTQSGIVVWRDHDRLHGGSPKRQRQHMDLVFYGIMQELGWQDYLIGFPQKPLLYEIPETTTDALAAQLVAKLNLTGARIVGNRDAKIRRVFFCEHVNGSSWGGRQPDCEAIREIETGCYDAMIPFEIIDWTLSAYVRDAAQLGQNKVLIEMGHFNVEELAMKYLAKWLKETVGLHEPIHFIQAGDSFSYYTAGSCRE
jgi:putative NIF3 family GTP cyclohydrolase 1 type 2